MFYNSPPPGFDEGIQIAACFCSSGGRFLLLKRVAGDKVAPGKWGLPGGKMKKNEKAIKAAIREVKEETGMKFKPADLGYFDSVYVKYPEFDFVFHMFYVELESWPAVKIGKKEHQEFYWAEPHEALQMDLVPDQDKCVKMFFNL